MTHPFLESLRQFRQMTRPRGPIRLSQFVGPEVPFDVVERRRQALQVLDNLGPDFDYTALEATIAKTNLKVQDTALMAEVLSLGKQMEADRKSLVGKAFGFGGAIPARVAEGLSFGLLRPSEEKLLGPRDKAIANLVGDLFSMGTMGIGTYKAFGYFTQMPKIAALAEQLPARVRSILFTGTAGAAAGAVIEAARPEGLPAEPSAIDLPARIGRFVEPITGERLGLAVGGAVVGGALDLVLSPILRGASLMRENRLINRDLPDEAVESVKGILHEAGIPFGTSESKAQLVRLLLANQGRIRLTGNVASVMAANNSRAQYVAQFIHEHPDKVFLQPKLPGSKAIGKDGLPIRTYHGTMVAVPEGAPTPRTRPTQNDLFGSVGVFFSEDPAMANVFTGHEVTATAGLRIGRTGERAPNVVTAYLDIKDPLDTRLPFDDRILDAFLREEGIEVGNLAAVREAFKTKYSNVEEYIAEGGNVAGVLRSKKVADAAKKGGYDGIVYSANLEQEMFSLQGQGDPASRIFIAFRGDQIRPSFTMKDDPVYLASLFINNPTGVSIARGITNEDAVIETARILGVRMMAVRAGETVLIARPAYSLPDIDVPASLVSRFKGAVKAENRGFRAEPVMHILPDGTKVIGKIDSESFARGAKITVPQNLTADRAVTEKMAIISAELRGDGTELAVSLPSRISNAQMAEISRFVDNSQIRRVILTSTEAGATPVVLDNPIGMQVQDRIAQVLKLPEPEVPVRLAKQMAQFVKTGVFEGQAAVLENGYAMRVAGRKSPTKLALKDPFTGETVIVDESRVGLLPTSLDGIATPNQLLLTRMNTAERTMLANALRSINSGFTDKVKTIAQLEKAANTRGLYLDKLDAGGIRLYDPVSGESNLYKDLDAATKGMKEMAGPMPDLTPPEMQAVLGDINVGMIGPPGPPPRFGERMPLPDDFDIPATFGPVPGAVRKAITPTRGLLQDIERIYNVPVGRTFLALQEQLVHRDNFLAAWVDGALPGLPKGIQPLGKILKRAGRDADQELITSWLLADTKARPDIVAKMTSQEVTAARELELWYEAAFDRFGVERDFIKVTLTNIRRWADRYGNDANEIWRKVRPGAPPPKGVDFVADHARDGSLDIYESRAFVAAGQFVHMGANNRFMKGVLEEAREVLWRIPDNAVKGPLVSYLEAIRGAEFAPMNAAITASIDNLFQSLGMTPAKTAGFSDRLALTILGLSYSATMAFRPGLAIRNITQTMQTTWTMFGGTDDSLLTGIGKAMTLAGRDQAILDGAISIRTGGFYAAEEMAQAMPEAWRHMSELGMKLYNGADHWNRAVAYWAGRTRAERAIAKFAERSKGAEREALQKARESLIDEASLFWFDKPVQDEFFRRLIQSPEKAAAWIGKNAADVTQYLYGRGNQAWWMRTVPGRFLGQYGTWPMWYMDFVRRSFMNAWRSGHHGQAIRFLGRLGIANAAIVGAGVAVGIDLGKWAGFSSLFFTGGPGAEALGGIATLQRGLGESLFDPDDPFAQSRLTEGSRILQRVGRAYIPMFYGVRDLDRMMNPKNPHDLATALLAANPTRRYTIQEQIDLLLNLGRLSTDIEIENRHPGELTAVEQIERANRLREGASSDLRRFFQPQPIAPQQGQPGTRPPSAAPGQPVPAPGEARPIIR